MRALDNTIFDDLSSVRKFMSALENLAGVSNYLYSRPELIGIGEEPKLVIDGKAESTGMKSD